MPPSSTRASSNIRPLSLPTRDRLGHEIHIPRRHDRAELLSVTPVPEYIDERRVHRLAHRLPALHHALPTAPHPRATSPLPPEPVVVGTRHRRHPRSKHSRLPPAHHQRHLQIDRAPRHQHFGAGADQYALFLRVWTARDVRCPV